jgi:hypothetical protein
MRCGWRALRLAAALAAAAVSVAACGGSDDQSDGTSRAPSNAGSSAKAATAGEAVTLGTGKNDGEFAIASANGTIKRPRSMRVAVTTDPDQQVTVSYTITCARRGRAAIAKSDRIVAEAPLDQELELPRGRLTDCVAAATVQLSDKGEVEVSLKGERPG